jgi:hypothetical protein
MPPDDFAQRSKVQPRSLIFEPLDSGPADDEFAALRAPPVLVVGENSIVRWLLTDRAIVQWSVPFPCRDNQCARVRHAGVSRAVIERKFVPIRRRQLPRPETLAQSHSGTSLADER